MRTPCVERSVISGRVKRMMSPAVEPKIFWAKGVGFVAQLKSGPGSILDRLNWICISAPISGRWYEGVWMDQISCSDIRLCTNIEKKDGNAE